MYHIPTYDLPEFEPPGVKKPNLNFFSLDTKVWFMVRGFVMVIVSVGNARFGRRICEIRSEKK